MLEEPRSAERLRASLSMKWSSLPADVLPMWVADMDFNTPEFIRLAVEQRARDGYYTYEYVDARLRETIAGWLQRRQGCAAAPEEIVMLPGVLPGVFNYARVLLEERPGGIITFSPLYRPLRELALAAGVPSFPVPWQSRDGGLCFDPEDVRRAAAGGASLLVLCSPHNPLGRVYRLEELLSLLAVAEEYDLYLLADEIWADLILDPLPHLPVAAVSPEAARRAISIQAPSKSFNMPGARAALALIRDASLRERLVARTRGFLAEANTFGLAAAHAAYSEGDAFLDELLQVLRANRALIGSFFSEHLPQVGVILPEASFLAWLDFSSCGITDARRFLLEKARVGLSGGGEFGAPASCARLNFACPEERLLDALWRIERAVSA